MGHTADLDLNDKKINKYSWNLFPKFVLSCQYRNTLTSALQSMLSSSRKFRLDQFRSYKSIQCRIWTWPVSSYRGTIYAKYSRGPTACRAPELVPN